jgi:hypothetical protein
MSILTDWLNRGKTECPQPPPGGSDDPESFKDWMNAHNYSTKQIGNSSLANAALQAYQGNLGYATQTDYTGWIGPALTSPPPKAYPESSAAAAGFAAGIKHALNVIMGPCRNDPEKAKLYEDLMSAAVKVVLAPEASDELSRRALFVEGDRWAAVVYIGESNPTEVTLRGVQFYVTHRASDECPMAVYRSR